MSADERVEIHQLAHALRTPIAVIQGFAELLIRDDGELTADQRRDYSQRIRGAAAEMRVRLDESVDRMDSAAG